MRHGKKKMPGTSKATKKGPAIEVVAVVWEDATFKLEREVGSALAVTFGVIHDINEERLVVASEVFDDDERRQFTTIPRGIVRRVITVKTIALPEFAPKGVNKD